MADRKVARRTPARVVKAQPALRTLAQAVTAALPVVGGDRDVWGDRLNALLGQLIANVTSAVYTVAGKTPDGSGNVTLAATDVGADASGAAAAAQSAAAADATSKVNALGSSLPAIYPSLDGNGRLAIGGIELTPAAVGVASSSGAPTLNPDGSITYAATSFGVDSTGQPYYNAPGAATGEGAIFTFDPTDGSPVLIPVGA